MNAPLDLSIIIVNWNSREYVRKCVPSIQANVRDLSFEIIVIDGASYDGCGEMLKQEFPLVRFIQCDKNVGFSRANNIAFEQSSGRCLMFLNPDTEVVGAAINVLFDTLSRQKDAGGLAPKLLNTDLTLQLSCVQAVPTILNQAFNSQIWSGFFSKAPFLGAQDAPVEIEVLPGACIMARREVFAQVGGFAPEYFMYCEDVDLSVQFRRAGYKNYYIPGASVIHHGGGSSEQAVSKFSAVMMRESVWRFLTKTRGGFYGFGYRISMMLTAIFRLVLLGALLTVRSIRGNPANARNSFQKWMAILRWSVGAETWIRQYN
jgi:GT2 family glycosyltransferase